MKLSKENKKFLGYIYLIVNNANGKTYVGQRQCATDYYLDRYMGSGKLIQRAEKKYGIENFEKFLIQYCYDKDSLDAAEEFWIAEYRRRGKAEYNIAKGSFGGDTFSWQPQDRKDEIRKTLSEACKGEKNGMKGKHLSEEARKKLSEAHIGKSPWNKGKTGVNGLQKGKKHNISEEGRKKMSEIHKGRSVSEETRRKMSEVRKGKHWKLVDGKRIYY